MSIVTIILFAFALSLDAFAVSIASGIIIKSQKIQNALKLSISFCFFQLSMPIIGWYSGRCFYPLIEKFAHWLAFFLLLFIGLKIIYEATRIENFEKAPLNISLAVLIGLGLATSMDALAVGLSLSCLNVNIIKPALIIGIITFLMSYLGFFVGNKFGHIFEKKIEIIAGLILIAIGFKILFEHLLTS